MGMLQQSRKMTLMEKAMAYDRMIDELHTKNIEHSYRQFVRQIEQLKIELVDKEELSPEKMQIDDMIEESDDKVERRLELKAKLA